MRVPVLVVLPSQEPLQESAMAFQQHRAPSIPITAANVPGPVQLDPTFAAVPVGTGRPQDAFIEALEPKVSQAFAVRGFVEVDSPEEIPSNYDGRPVFSEPQIQAFITCGGSPAMGDTALLKTKLNVPQLGSKGLDGSGVAVVVMDSGINLAHLTSQLGATPLIDVANSWTPPGSSTLPGKHPIDHGTMCAFDVLIAAPKATLLDFPMLAGTAPGGAIVGRTLSVALQAYAYLMANWAVAYAPGGPSKYRALVVTNSWGVYHPSWDFPVAHPGRYCDNPRHPFNLIVTALANSGADIVFAAGNCGAQCADGRCQGRTVETIMGANALDVVLTLAGCDTSDQRVGYSSQGPSISGMPPNKPDLAAYTHFLGSEAFGAGSPDSGTSAACPVAAGCVAALRTKLSPVSTPPANLFAQLRATAQPLAGQTGWNGDSGHGIIDPLTAANSLGV